MYYVGIDIGGMSIKGGLVSQDGKLVCKETIKTATYSKEYSIAQDIKVLINQILKHNDLTSDDIIGIGIGSPGSINSEEGVIRYANNIPMTNVKVVSELKEYFPVPIRIDNDANCAALGEQIFGAGRGYNNIVFITLGTGVGSGIIIDNKIIAGCGGAGAEAGHMVIISNGMQCNCGRKGCWEVYASATALMRQTREKMAECKDSMMHDIAKKDGEVNGRTAFIAAKAGDKAGQEVVDQYIKYIGEGLINMANIFRPEVILIGGGISNEKEYLTNPLQKMVDDCTFGGDSSPKVIVKTASLKNDAGIFGAVALVYAN